MARLRYNGLTATLGAAMDATQTSITFEAALTSAAGAVPTIGGSDYIPLTILDSAGAVSEIVSLTAYTSGATTGTVTRAQESTTGVAHAPGDAVVHSATVLDFTSAIYMDFASSAGGGSTTLTTTWTDWPSLLLTLPVKGSSDTFLIRAFLNYLNTVSGGGDVEVRLVIDGLPDASIPVFYAPSASPARWSSAPQWLVTGLAAGSRVVKVQTRIATSGGNVTMQAGGSISAVR